jgi:hypothetical protein
MSSTVSNIVNQMNTIMVNYNLAKSGVELVTKVRADHVPIHLHPVKKKIEQENLKKWGCSIVF